MVPALTCCPAALWSSLLTGGTAGLRALNREALTLSYSCEHAATLRMQGFFRRFTLAVSG